MTRKICQLAVKFYLMPYRLLRRKHNLVTGLILIFGIAVLFFVQFSTPTLYDADGYLHIRMAEFLKDFGPRYNFHWARFSTFNGNFADKDFLYHAVLIPFTFFKDIFLGVKIAAFIFAVILLLGFYFILKRYCGNKFLADLALFSFALSSHFLEAINSPRPLTIVILLNLFCVHLIIQKRYLGLFFTGVFYALMHVTSPLIIIYAIIIESARYFDKKGFSFRTVLSCFLGVLTGFLAHPNFPNNFLVFYLNSILVPIYTMKTGVLELGAEFFPLNTRDYLLFYPVIIISIISLAFLSFKKEARLIKFETKAFMSIAALFFVLSFIASRYLSHGYLIMLIGFSCYFSDCFKQSIEPMKRFLLPFAAIIGVLLAINSFNGNRYNALVAKVINGHYEAAGKWMEKNIPEGELIFHANWSDSQYFIGLNPKNDYFVTLDPVYMYNKNPELYKLYRDVAFGRTKDPYVLLKDTFNVKYGYAGKSYFNGLVEQIRKDSRFTILAEDQLGIIFKLS